MHWMNWDNERFLALEYDNLDYDDINVGENWCGESEGDDSIHILHKFLKPLSIKTLHFILMDIMNFIVRLGGFE